RWPRPPGLAVHVMNDISLLSTPEPSAEPCEHERHQHPRRGLHRDPAVLAEGPRHPLGRRRTGQQNDALRLDIVHHPLERGERLQHIEPEQDALGHRQQIREPDAVHREGRLRLASGPPRGDEPRPEFGERIGLGPERFLVVEAQVHAGRQRLAVNELATGQQRDIVAGGEKRDSLFDGATVTIDVGGVASPYPGSAELAVTPRRLGDDEDAAHRRASPARAGTPITVAPGGTSSTTTAPPATTPPPTTPASIVPALASAPTSRSVPSTWAREPRSVNPATVQPASAARSATARPCPPAPRIRSRRLTGVPAESARARAPARARPAGN